MDDWMIYLLIIQWKLHFLDFSIFLVCTYFYKYLVVATILPIGPHYVTLFQPNQAWNRWILHKLCWLVLWIIIFGQYMLSVCACMHINWKNVYVVVQEWTTDWAQPCRSKWTECSGTQGKQDHTWAKGETLLFNKC